MDAVLVTKNWLKQIVIGCGFCPFAAKPFYDDKIAYVVIDTINDAEALEQLNSAFTALDDNDAIETTLLIFTNHLKDFNTYLNFLYIAENYLQSLGYEGEYQLASFHPNYVFEGESILSATNYTNRSPLPIIHILRESSVEDAVEQYPADAANIYEKNINYTQQKGFAFMKALLAKCME
jgi:uncharacterized protein